MDVSNDQKKGLGLGREGKSGNGKTRTYILRVILGGKEEAEAEHMGLGHFMSLPAKGVAVHARGRGSQG